MDWDRVEVHKLPQKKNKANIQPSWPKKVYHMAFGETFLMGHGG